MFIYFNWMLITLQYCIDTLLNNQQITEEIKKEIKMCIEMKVKTQLQTYGAL